MRVTISRRARGLLRFRFRTPDADMSDADMLHDASGIFAGLPPTYPVLLLPNSTPEWEPDSAPPVARGDGASFVGEPACWGAERAGGGLGVTPGGRAQPRPQASVSTKDQSGVGG